MKVFKLNDCDWWAGDSLEAVKAAYMAETGLDEDEAFDDARECTEKELAEIQFYIGDPHEDDVNTISFAERLEYLIKVNTVTPCLFASSEY